MNGDNPFVRRRVGVCGSSQWPSRYSTDVCSSIGRCLARANNVIIVSGSTKRRSAEGLVISAAAAELTREQIDSRIVSYVDSGSSNSDDVIGSPKRARGKTSEARRIAFVRDLNALIAVGGGDGTRQELALAIEFGTRVLPAAGIKGASEEVWRAYRSEIMKALDVREDLAQRWEHLASLDRPDLRSVAESMVEALLRSLPRRCFVIMPYHDTLAPLYDKILKPAIASAGDDPVHIGRLGAPGNVMTQIEDGLRTCDYAIAVLDDLRHNVMYELGMAHAHGKTTILINRKGGLTQQVPFDIYSQQRLEYTEFDDAFREQVSQAIHGLVTRRI